MDNKVIRRQKLRWRIRSKISGTAECPRLSVFRSNKDVYLQLVDDVKRITLCSTNSKKMTGNKIEQSVAAGKALAEKAIALNIQSCVFDRGGYLYHGRVKAVAEGAREGGLKF